MVYTKHISAFQGLFYLHIIIDTNSWTLANIADDCSDVIKNHHTLLPLFYNYMASYHDFQHKFWLYRTTRPVRDLITKKYLLK